MTESVMENSTEDILQERFLLAKERIGQIGNMTGEKPEIAGEYVPYFKETADYVEKLLREWNWQRQGGLEQAALDELREHNHALYQDILPENYAVCWGNPAYTVSLYGEEMGRLLAFLYAELHSQIESVYENELEELVLRMELFLEIYQSFVCAYEEQGKPPAYEELRQIVYWFVSDYSEAETEKRIRRQLDPGQDFLLKIVMEAELDDSCYLYRYGEYVNENTEKLAAYLNRLTEERIKKMADTFTEGYRKGFVVGGKDLSRKKTVNIRYVAGFERVIRQAIKNFADMGLQTTLYRASVSIFHKRGVSRVGFYGADANKQFLYDHKEDESLYLDKRYVSRRLEGLRAAYEAVKELAAVHGGPACMEAFGEVPFAPAAKPEACQLTQQQQRLSVEYAAAAGELVNQYIKGEERSFTIIAFPVPEIGKDFEEIFDAVIKINTLDYAKYQRMQQWIIDVLDKGTFVHIRGCGKNRTDLTVALHPLADPERETIFENCVADVNIPVGEVFTSPRLEGTRGVLHVTRVFLNELEYKELELKFTDGMVTAYSCGNFSSEEENRKYIKDNLLFHHDSLPMGEFAIGTNTTAYVAARKYKMADKLPILIAEKTGPHFALGDTCYSHSEDLAVYNPDGKEIIARDNSCSLKRREDPEQAYFNCHTDITIPYDELGELTVTGPDGIDQCIIRNGRFVLEGCEELNLPFEMC